MSPRNLSECKLFWAVFFEFTVRKKKKSLKNSSVSPQSEWIVFWLLFCISSLISMLKHNTSSNKNTVGNQLLCYKELKGHFPLMKSLFYQIRRCYTPYHWQPFKRIQKLKALFEDKGEKVICLVFSPANLAGWPFDIQMKSALNCFYLHRANECWLTNTFKTSQNSPGIKIQNKYCNMFPCRQSTSTKFTQAIPTIMTALCFGPMAFLVLVFVCLSDWLF